MDMNSFSAATGELLGNEATLHDLINRAGIMATPFEMTGIRSGSHSRQTISRIGFLHATFTTTGPAKGEVCIVNILSMGPKQAPPKAHYTSITSIWTRSLVILRASSSTFYRIRL